MPHPNDLELPAIAGAGLLHYPRMAAHIGLGIWAIQREAAAIYLPIMARRIAGQPARAEDLEKAAAERAKKQTEVLAYHADAFTDTEVIDAAKAAPMIKIKGTVGILPIMGVLEQRADMYDEASGVVSAERIGRVFDAMLRDSEVGAIVANFDSPGGNVHGIEELANRFFNARGQKPLIAQVNSTCASAAYWLASQFDEIVVTPGGQAGSIGVITVHEDWSKHLAEFGVVMSMITAGTNKGEYNPFNPLSDEDRAALQSRVNTHYNVFTEQVARGRGVKASEVRKGFGEGRCVLAEECVEVGLADRVATLEQTLQRFRDTRVKTSSGNAKSVSNARIQLASARLKSVGTN